MPLLSLLLMDGAIYSIIMINKKSRLGKQSLFGVCIISSIDDVWKIAKYKGNMSETEVK